MSGDVAVQPVELTDRAKRALDRIKEVFGVLEVPAALTRFALSETGINDLYMNLNRQLQDGKVSKQTKLLVALGVATAVGSPQAVEFFRQAVIAAGRTTADTAEAIHTAITCSTYNAYYRFRSQVPNDLAPTYSEFKATFNGSVFLKPPFDEREVEAICVAVSSVNNCMKCVDGHVNKAKSLGYQDDQIDEIIKAGAAAFAFALACNACQ